MDDGGPMLTALTLFCVEDLPFGDAVRSPIRLKGYLFLFVHVAGVSAGD